VFYSHDTAYYVYGMEKFLDTIGEYLEIHSTFADDVSKIPNHIVNHGELTTDISVTTAPVTVM